MNQFQNVGNNSAGALPFFSQHVVSNAAPGPRALAPNTGMQPFSIGDIIARLNIRYDDLGPHAPGFKFHSPDELARKLDEWFPDNGSLQPSAAHPVVAAYAQLAQQQIEHQGLQQQLRIQLERHVQGLQQTIVWQSQQLAALQLHLQCLLHA